MGILDSAGQPDRITPSTVNGRSVPSTSVDVPLPAEAAVHASGYLRLLEIASGQPEMFRVLIENLSGAVLKDNSVPPTKAVDDFIALGGPENPLAAALQIAFVEKVREITLFAHELRKRGEIKPGGQDIKRPQQEEEFLRSLDLFLERAAAWTGSAAVSKLIDSVTSKLPAIPSVDKIRTPITLVTDATVPEWLQTISSFRSKTLALRDMEEVPPADLVALQNSVDLASASLAEQREKLRTRVNSATATQGSMHRLIREAQVQLEQTRAELFKHPVHVQQGQLIQDTDEYIKSCSVEPARGIISTLYLGCLANCVERLAISYDEECTGSDTPQDHPLVKASLACSGIEASLLAMRTKILDQLDQLKPQET